MIQSGGFLCGMLRSLGNIGKEVSNEAIANFIPLARDNFFGIVSNLASSVIDKLGRKINGKGAGSIGRGFTLFVSNRNMNDIIKIIKSLEDSEVLIDGVNEAVKHEIKNKKMDFFLLS